MCVVHIPYIKSNDSPRVGESYSKSLQALLLFGDNVHFTTKRQFYECKKFSTGCEIIAVVNRVWLEEINAMV